MNSHGNSTKHENSRHLSKLKFPENPLTCTSCQTAKKKSGLYLTRFSLTKRWYVAHTQSRPSHMEDWVIYIYTVVYIIHEAVRAGHPAYSSLIRNNQFKCLFYCVKLGLLLPPVLHIYSHKLWWHPDCLQWAGGLH